MGKYLLLRDNKESGPYLLDDLVRLGLKPYDLVWQEGKSAAWRYPSEVNELKPFAPVVEEQPFDRFYKKATEEKGKPEYTTAPQDPSYSPYAPPVEQKEELKFVPKKSVFVTLPGQKLKATDKAEPEPLPMQSSLPKPSPVPPTITITESPEAAEIKYSQPLDEIKEMYVKTLQQRKNKTVRRGILIANLKKAAVIAGLIFLGAAAGVLIKSKHNSNDNLSSQTLQSTPIIPLSDSATGDITNANSKNDNLLLDEQPQENNQTEEQGLAKNSDELANNNSQPTTIKIRKETMMSPAEKKEVFNDEQTDPGVETDAVTGERNRKIRSGHTNTDDQAVSKLGKKRLNDLVSVSSNDYKRVAFGGIRNLQLTVTNNSGFELDHVVVELQYLKPSEEPFRTENIRFQAISPNTSATIKVPDTNRGIKVLYKIINIESKQNDDAVAGM